MYFICRKEDTCNVIGNLPLGYKSICKQKFIQRELLSVSSNGSMSPDTFLFPSSCCCHVTFTTNTRMGFERQSQVKSIRKSSHQRRKRNEVSSFNGAINVIGP